MKRHRKALLRYHYFSTPLDRGPVSGESFSDLDAAICHADNMRAKFGRTGYVRDEWDRPTPSIVYFCIRQTEPQSLPTDSGVG